MSHDDELWQSILLRLKQSLQTLSMPSQTQLALLPDFVCKADELVLTFDHWYLCICSNDEGTLSDQQKSALQAIDKHFDSMTAKSGKDVWTEEAVRNAPEWEALRGLAKEALATFGWEIAVPPNYSFEYVPGHKNDT